jgi:hypothetical protein
MTEKRLEKREGFYKLLFIVEYDLWSNNEWNVDAAFSYYDDAKAHARKKVKELNCPIRLIDLENK